MVWELILHFNDPLSISTVYWLSEFCSATHATSRLHYYNDALLDVFKSKVWYEEEERTWTIQKLFRHANTWRYLPDMAHNAFQI